MLILNAFIGVMIMMTILWLISIVIKNVSIVDIFWGFGFIVVNNIYLMLDDDVLIREIILNTLVTIWGLRLSIYLFIRNYRKEEDFRYKEFRRVYGEKRYWWLSFFQVFLLQGTLIIVISLPLFGVNTYTATNDLNIIDYLACLVWIVGFLFESVGDYQLSKFRSNPLNKGKVLDKGLWRFTRHPNYFGDALIWWSYGLFSLASGAYWQIIGALIMTYLLLRISGVTLLEKTLKTTKPEYSNYIKRTSAFFPRLPKKEIK